MTNGGTIDATGAAAAIGFYGAVTNSGTMEAVSGNTDVFFGSGGLSRIPGSSKGWTAATIRFTSDTVINTGGTLLASSGDSSVGLNGTTISGGTVEALGSSTKIEVSDPGNALDGVSIGAGSLLSVGLTAR